MSTSFQFLNFLLPAGRLEAAAFGLPDESCGQVVAVGVVLKPRFECDEDALTDYSREHLGSFRMPSEIYLVDDLPKGPSGKIQCLEFANRIIESGDSRN